MIIEAEARNERDQPSVCEEVMHRKSKIVDKTIIIVGLAFQN